MLITRIQWLLMVAALTACGTDNSDSNDNAAQAKPSVSSAQTSSQPTSKLSIDSHRLSYIYPTQQANVSGFSQLPLVVHIADATADEATVSQLNIGGVEFVKTGAYWYSSTDLSLEASPRQQFEVKAEIAETGDWLTLAPLVLNSGGNIAGSERIYSAKGIAFDTDDTELYFTNAYDAMVYQFDLSTGRSEVIYQGEPSTPPNDNQEWPIAVDSPNNTAYIATDRYGSASVDTDYSVSFVSISHLDSTPSVAVFKDETRQVLNPKGLVLDFDATIAGSRVMGKPTATAYALHLGETPLVRWYTEGADDIIGSSNLYSPIQEADANLSKAFGLAAITAKFPMVDGQLLAARKYSTIEFRGSPALVELSTEDDNVGGKSSIIKHLTDLKGITVPTALAYNREGTHVYIADIDRVWKMNMADYTKELVTSSGIQSKGRGVRIGGGVTAMVIHPVLDYLYLAADTKGIIMVDLATGDRITVAK